MKKTDKKRRKERKPKSRKKVIFLEILSLGSVAMAFGFLWILSSFFSDEQGHYNMSWMEVMIFIGLMLLALGILISILPDVANQEMKKYGKAPFCVLPDASKENVLRTFQKMGFREHSEGVYRKKKFSFLKDSICYYLYFVDAQDLDTACDIADARFESIHERTRTICLFLFVYKDKITDSDKQDASEMSSFQLVYAPLLSMENNGYTVIPILVANTTGEGVYLAKTTDISTYAYGCRLLKKYFDHT